MCEIVPFKRSYDEDQLGYFAAEAMRLRATGGQDAEVIPLINYRKPAIVIPIQPGPGGPRARYARQRFDNLRDLISRVHAAELAQREMLRAREQGTNPDVTP